MPEQHDAQDERQRDGEERERPAAHSSPRASGGQRLAQEEECQDRDRQDQPSRTPCRIAHYSPGTWYGDSSWRGEWHRREDKLPGSGGLGVSIVIVSQHILLA